MSIRAKLILSIASILIVAGFAISAAIYWQNSQIFTEHTNTDIIGTVHLTSQLVDFYINRAESNLANLAKDPLVINALESKNTSDYGQVSDKLTAVEYINDVLANVALMEIKGSSCITRAANSAALSAVGQDFSDRDYCKGVIRTKTNYLSSAYISSITGEPVLGLVVPVSDVQGEMLGFVYGSINLGELRGYLWDLQQDSKVELLDRYGVMFLSTEESIDVLDVLSEEEQSEIDQIVGSIAAGRNSGFLNDSINSIGYESNGEITVVYEKSAASLLSTANNLNLTVFISVLSAILLTILIIYFFIGSITRRISRLSKISQEIAGGKFNIKMNAKDLNDSDETAVLARAFNDMAGKLANTYGSLEKKVKERTKKLEESEKATAKALEISERANRLMVDRELEMIRLKNELTKARNSTKSK